MNNSPSHRSIPLTILAVLLIIAILLLAASRSQAAPPQESTPATLRLKSRTLTPAPGVEAGLVQEKPRQQWHGLIQLSGAPDAALRATLAQAGVTLLGYIPDNTWLASLPPDLAPVMAIPGVHWIGRLYPADRLDPELQGGTFGAWAQNADGTVNLWVDVFADTPLPEMTAAITALGGYVTGTLPEYRRLQVALPPAAVWSLAAEDAVQWIAQAPAPLIALNDGARAVIEADVVQASPYNLTGIGVTAGMWDVGVVDATHPDLAGRTTVVETGAPVGHHPTHVAGIMGGNGSNSVNYGGSVGQWRGIAPALQIFSFYWDAPTIDHDAAINTYGIDLSQNSWGLGGCSTTGKYDGYARDYDSIVTGLYGRHIPIIFAAGNLRDDCAEPYGTVHGGPQSAKNTITVGGVSSVDGSMMAMSSWGPVRDGRLKPEVVAAGQTSPGTGIYSTFVGGGYGYIKGTSMAAPAVSGSVALILERYHNICPKEGDEAGNPLPSTIKAILIDSAEDLNDPATDYYNLGPDFSSGYGLVDDEVAAEVVGQNVEGSATSGEVATYPLFVVSGMPSLKVTLAWDDVPAEANADVALVNDLDLELVAPDGSTVYGPWILNATGNQEREPAQRFSWMLGEPGVRDTTNVAEQVVVDNPTPGVWTARVIGSNVPQGPQSFSLVSATLQEDICQGSPTAISMAAVAAGASGYPPLLLYVLPSLAFFTILALAVQRRRRLALAANR